MAARCASRCGRVRERANCFNSAQSSSDKTSLDRLDLPAMPKHNRKQIYLFMARLHYKKAIVQLGFCGEREVLQAKAQEAGLGFADLDRMTIDSSALNVVPERIVKNHSAIPVRKDGNTLWVAMSNPNNVSAIDDFRIASGCRVVPVLAVPGREMGG